MYMYKYIYIKVKSFCLRIQQPTYDFISFSLILIHLSILGLDCAKYQKHSLCFVTTHLHYC